MKKQLISVIVPIYNVEAYLEKCIDSIIKQSYNELEIILIDDGSIDRCGEICDNYKEKDERIIVVHKENDGLSSARNKGLDIAKGELISFVDSDDYLEPNMFEELIKNMKKYNSDISICNYFYVKNGSKRIINNIFYKNDFVISGKDKYYYLFNEYNCLSIYAWNKLYKKELFDNIRFPEGKIFEYSNIICELLDKSNKLSYTSKPLYNYVYRNNSIGNSFSQNYFDKIVSNNKKIDFFNKKKYYDLIQKETNNKVDNIFFVFYMMKKNKIKNKELFNNCYQELLNTNKEVKWKDASKKVKLFKIFRRPSISILAIVYRVRDFIRR